MPRATRKRLFLVDGMSHVYRAYYAIRGLSTSTGIPTNAIYGFTNILRKLITDEKPDYLGVVLDSREKTFRHDVYHAYKATRSAMPDDLAPQLPYIEQVCEVLRIPVVRISGFEADDVIGTLAQKAEAQGLDVVIVTNDKDLCQLVNDHIKVLKTDRTGGMTLMDAATVEEKMGVPPEHVVDLLGLWGDTIDNIPGAPGVGEKGARQLIQQFGSIENAIAQADKIERKQYRESLKNNVDLIMKSKDLVTIIRDAPVELDLEGLIYQEPDGPAAYRLFSELEFVLLVREFQEAALRDTAPKPATRTDARELSYVRLRTRDAFDEFVQTIWASDRVAIAALQRDDVLAGLAFSTSANSAALVDFDAFQGGDPPLSELREIFENGLIRKATFDWKGMLVCLDGYCIANGNLPAVRLEGVEDDLMLAAYLLDPNRANYRVADIAREHLAIDVPEQVGDFEQDELRSLRAADLTFQLSEVLPEKIREAGLEPVYREIELPLVEILFEIEKTGVRIDTEALAAAGSEMEQELERLTAAIYACAGCEFNINSTMQLGEIFEKLNFDVGRKTKTGRISTSSDVLEELAAKYELPRLIIEYRELSKLKGTYVDALPRLINPRTGRIHTTLNQAVAATGRLSSTNPNLQNIPIRTETGRRIRKAFVPEPGWLLMSADYSQIELRVFAHITGDPAMTEAFTSGEDIHAQTARAVFGAKTEEEEASLRRLAKIVNFAIAYAVGPFGLAQRTTLTRGEARKAIENYYKTYVGVRRYMEETPEKVRKSGLVSTIFGRIRPIPDINNRNHALRARAEREAINAPIQGTAADLMKIAMIKVHERLKRENLAARIILQVHDELLLEVPESETEAATNVVREEMESVHRLSVPLLVDVGVGKNWMEAKP